MKNQNKNQNRSYKGKHSIEKKLYALSGNQCAKPDCNNKIILSSNVGEIIHIHALNPGGLRHDPSMADEERNHIENLMVLCRICHKNVDDPANLDIYPANLLKDWKKNHERKIREIVFKDSSLLQIVIDKISKLDDIENNNNEAVFIKKPPFDIQEKLDYNALSKNRLLIEEYKVYYGKINALYNELDKQASFKKTKLLRNIKDIYLKISRNYFDENTKNHQEIIIKNSDKIFEEIENYILDKIVNATDNDLFAVSIIMVHAFMECKILEEPKKS